MAVARRADRIDTLASQAGQCVVPFTSDVTSEAGRRAVAEAAGHRSIASLVHGAASVVRLTPWAELDSDELVEHFRIHVAAPIALTRTLLARGPIERMATLDSYAATTLREGWSAYSLLKASAQVSARAAAVELADTAVIRIFPGAVESPHLRSVLDDRSETPAVSFYRSLVAAGRVSDPLDVGRQIAAILIDEPLDALRSTEVWHVGHRATPPTD